VSAFSSNNYAVYGSVTPSGIGTAIYGDAGASSTSWAGYFNGDVSAVGYYNNSDARLKRDVTAEVAGLKDLLALRPVNYKWKNRAAGDKLQHGLIAQEVQEVLPELVRADGKTGMLGINYVALVPVAVRAIQEQERVIRAQDARIAALESRLRPSTVSLNSGYGGLGLALGLLPVGLIFVRRRNRSKGN
jgi:hypothetical protein